MRPLLVRELTLRAQRLAQSFRPEGIFVYKGNVVHPDLIRFYKERGIPTVNVYPDVSFRTHGRYIPLALPLYDHIFTTKSWGVADMQQQLGAKSIGFLEHGFDPEIHRPLSLSDKDRKLYGCDVVFIGVWSPKKEKLLAHLKRALPSVRLVVWGSQWGRSRSPEIATSLTGDEILGDEYSKALQGASICLGFLSEITMGASSGDLTTSRTFEIPACGAFMLHERNAESVRYFTEDKEAGFFESADELVEKVEFYLKHRDERLRVAACGRERCLQSGYSLDARMIRVESWFAAHLPTVAPL
jgi:spore maturation protein CgeB